jgi:hypothetical protein
MTLGMESVKVWRSPPRATHLLRGLRILLMLVLMLQSLTLAAHTHLPHQHSHEVAAVWDNPQADGGSCQHCCHHLCFHLLISTYHTAMPQIAQSVPIVPKWFFTSPPRPSPFRPPQV